MQENLSLLESARLMAMTYTSMADGYIGCFNAKYHFSFWRPVTAIRNGDIDGNPDTVADPTWSPLTTTPGHPEYPSAHGCVPADLQPRFKPTLERRIFSFPSSAQLPAPLITSRAFTISKRVDMPVSIRAFTTTIRWFRGSCWGIKSPTISLPNTFDL